MIKGIGATPRYSGLGIRGFPYKGYSTGTPMFGCNQAFPLGTLITQDFTTMTTLNDYTITSPGSTWALSGGFLHITNTSGAGGFANTMQYNTYGSSNLMDYAYECVFRPQDKVANGFGLTIGNINTNLLSGSVWRGLFNTSSGVNSGKITIYFNTTAKAATTVALAWSVGDRIKLNFSKTDFTFTFTATNLTAGGSKTVSYTASQSTTTETIDTTRKPCLFSNGGTQDVEYFTYSSPDYKNPRIAFFGDSITAGYDASSVPNRWVNQLNIAGSRLYTNSGSPSTYTAAILQCINEMMLINPEYAICMFGGNDVALSVSPAAYKANYTNIINQLKANGCKVIHCLATPRNAFDMSAVLNPFIQTFSGDIIIDTFTPLKNGTALASAYDSGDGTHPNDAGHALIGQSVLNTIVNLNVLN